MTRLEADMAQMREEWAVVQQTPLIQSRLLNALRATQLEHSQALTALDARLSVVETRLESHSVKLDLLAQGQQVLVGMLTTLIDREPGEK